jgi:hypothetical protein
MPYVVIQAIFYLQTARLTCVDTSLQAVCARKQAGVAHVLHTNNACVKLCKTDVGIGFLTGLFYMRPPDGCRGPAGIIALLTCSRL